MQLQRQGELECQLATIAMLADVPLLEVRTRALELTQTETWASYFNTQRASRVISFWLIASMLCSEYGVSMTLPDTDTGVTPGEAPNINLSGKGQITVVWNNNTAHAIAYEDGIVYDGNLTESVSWDIWLSTEANRYKQCGIKSIIVSPCR